MDDRLYLTETLYEILLTKKQHEIKEILSKLIKKNKFLEISMPKDCNQKQIKTIFKDLIYIIRYLSEQEVNKLLSCLITYNKI